MADRTVTPQESREVKARETEIMRQENSVEAVGEFFVSLSLSSFNGTTGHAHSSIISLIGQCVPLDRKNKENEGRPINEID